VIGAQRRGVKWGSYGRTRMVGDEGRSRKPRVTTRKKSDLATSRGDGGFIVSKAARKRDTSKLDSYEMSPLYKITVSLWV
jgi:hypothetical protein